MHRLKELLSIVYALNCYYTYCYGQRDGGNGPQAAFAEMCKKPLAAAPKHLQRMWLLFQRYDFALVCRKSSGMHIADTLSRAYPPVSTQSTAFPEELTILSTVDADQLSQLKMVASTRMIDIKKRRRVTTNTLD
jgi:hypothetical protein